jgi:hypothetical protein
MLLALLYLPNSARAVCSREQACRHKFVLGYFEGTDTGCELFIGPQATLGVGVDAGAGLEVSAGAEEGVVPVAETVRGK